MDVKDLNRRPPRRWNETLDGIRWLPRLIDKTRAALAGCLGDYLFGQSPVDRGLLTAMGLGHRAFAQIVVGADDDEAVLAALKERSPDDLAAARAWSDALPRSQRYLLPLLDLDDGYTGGAWGLLRLPCNAAAWVVAKGAKTLMPRHPADGVEPPRPAGA
ncbi:MAG: DUF5069 domain-containing protein [Vulcanimicrobiaceae bacterium]